MKKVTLASVAAVALTACSATAQPAGQPRGPDSNNDGVITRAEAQAAAEGTWQRLDVNRDGIVNQADRQARQAQRFAELDANKDGQVTAAEFEASRERGEQAREQRQDRRRAEWFARFDRDKSGGLSQAELAAVRGSWSRRNRADVSAASAGEGHGAKPRMGGRPHSHGDGMMMRMADANRDGTLTRAEFDAAQQRHWTMVDIDKDGLITREEMSAAHKRMMAAHHAPRAKPAD